MHFTVLLQAVACSERWLQHPCCAPPVSAGLEPAAIASDV